MATQKEVAAHLDLSDRQIRNLISTGILPAGRGKGGLDLDDCRRSYISYLRGLSSGQVQVKGDLDLTEQRAILCCEQAREKKRQNDLEEQLVAPVSVITEAIEQVAKQMIPILDALPLRMKRNNPLLSGHDIHLVRKSVAECRNIIAQIKLPDDKD
ncbi:hypothetical protein [Desulfocastanea catecholica]